jgi:hypothetical protein
LDGEEEEGEDVEDADILREVAELYRRQREGVARRAEYAAHAARAHEDAQSDTASEASAGEGSRGSFEADGDTYEEV